MPSCLMPMLKFLHLGIFGYNRNNSKVILVMKVTQFITLLSLVCSLWIFAITFIAQLQSWSIEHLTNRLWLWH